MENWGVKLHFECNYDYELLLKKIYKNKKKNKRGKKKPNSFGDVHMPGYLAWNQKAFP